MTVKDLLNRFLTSKKQLVDTGEIVYRTFAGHLAICKSISERFGLNRLVSDLASDDFEKLRGEFAKTLAPISLGEAIQRVRTVFKYGYDAGLIDKPIRFGPNFRRPSKKSLRLARNGSGLKMFERSEINTILDAANIPLRAMTLLGVNCGFGNHDCGALPVDALDLEAGWVDHPRPKTGVRRRCPLWPETVEAVRLALANRPEAKNARDSELVFITPTGLRWVRLNPSNVWVDGLNFEFSKLLRKLGLKRPGLSFYALRHTFETIGGESIDQVSVNFLMGHAPDSGDMGSVYRERISDERLRAVADHVRRWLFGGANHA